MITKRQFNTENWGEFKNPKWGFIYRPDDTSKKYPIVFYFHGNGEKGSTQTSAESLKNIGPLAFISTNPQFIIVAIQDAEWSPIPKWYDYILHNDQEVKNNWDGVTVGWYGISAGGQRVIQAMAEDYPYNNFYVAMSPAEYNNNLIDFKKPHRSWFFHASDDTTCPYSYSVGLVAMLNKAFPGSADLYTYKGGHGGWNEFFDPEFTINGKNIYAALNANDIPAPLPSIPEKKLLRSVTINFYDDNSFDVK